jgi:hypothetical protein
MRLTYMNPANTIVEQGSVPNNFTVADQKSRERALLARPARSNHEGHAFFQISTINHALISMLLSSLTALKRNILIT